MSPRLRMRLFSEAASGGGGATGLVKRSAGVLPRFSPRMNERQSAVGAVRASDDDDDDDDGGAGAAAGGGLVYGLLGSSLDWLDGGGVGVSPHAFIDE